MTTRARVLIVDDEPIARGGVRRLLEARDNVEVIGECGSGTAAVEFIARERPDLVLSARCAAHWRARAESSGRGLQFDAFCVGPGGGGRAPGCNGVYLVRRAYSIGRNRTAIPPSVSQFGRGTRRWGTAGRRRGERPL